VGSTACSDNLLAHSAITLSRRVHRFEGYRSADEVESLVRKVISPSTVVAILLLTGDWAVVLIQAVGRIQNK
jgi:hypothetical protein